MLGGCGGSGPTAVSEGIAGNNTTLPVDVDGQLDQPPHEQRCGSTLVGDSLRVIKSALGNDGGRDIAIRNYTRRSPFS